MIDRIEFQNTIIVGMTEEYSISVLFLFLVFSRMTTNAVGTVVEHVKTEKDEERKKDQSESIDI